MISVIIPTLNEERALPATLAAVLAQGGDFEVLVVDGGSADATTAIAEELAGRHSHLRLFQSQRGRAQQLNCGAAAAVGRWLLFLHADTLLPGAGLDRIAALPPSIRAGCFRHRFSGTGPMLRTLSWFHNQRFKMTRLIYGDQGLFIQRDLFSDLGGYPLQHMEDIAFGLKLRAVTKPIMLPETVVTDSRKFEQMGAWRALFHAVSLLVRFRFSSDIDRNPFFDDYR